MQGNIGFHAYLQLLSLVYERTHRPRAYIVAEADGVEKAKRTDSGESMRSSDGVASAWPYSIYGNWMLANQPHPHAPVACRTYVRLRQTISLHHPILHLALTSGTLSLPLSLDGPNE